MVDMVSATTDAMLSNNDGEETRFPSQTLSFYIPLGSTRPEHFSGERVIRTGSPHLRAGGIDINHCQKHVEPAARLALVLPLKMEPDQSISALHLRRPTYPVAPWPGLAALHCSWRGLNGVMGARRW